MGDAVKLVMEEAGDGRLLSGDDVEDGDDGEKMVVVLLGGGECLAATSGSRRGCD